MNSGTPNEWFKEWFDSPYYHILYNHRDDEEATFFIDHLIDFLKPDKDSAMLDLACGRGRHAVYLNKKGFDVTGVDLSPENIRFASVFANDQLRFYVHDMRHLITTNGYNYIFNLFTSFGYFERKHENLKAIKNMASALKPGGKLVLDFLNVEHITEGCQGHQIKDINGIRFYLNKEIRNDQVIKKIRVEDGQKTFDFEEKVMLLQEQDFQDYFSKSNLKIINTFGSYDLESFDLKNSDRLIYIVQKA